MTRRGLHTEHNYYLTEAFERLGRHLFGDRWSGYEIMLLNGRLRRGAWPRCTAAKGPRRPDDPAAMDEYERRDHVEEVLLAALRAGEIEAVLDRSFVIPARFWRGEEAGFRCRLELSLAVAPPSVSSRRVNPVLVPIRAFEEWLRTVPPIWPRVASSRRRPRRAPPSWPRRSTAADGSPKRSIAGSRASAFPS